MPEPSDRASTYPGFSVSSATGSRQRAVSLLAGVAVAALAGTLGVLAAAQRGERPAHDQPDVQVAPSENDILVDVARGGDFCPPPDFASDPCHDLAAQCILGVVQDEQCRPTVVRIQGGQAVAFECACISPGEKCGPIDISPLGDVIFCPGGCPTPNPAGLCEIHFDGLRQFVNSMPSSAVPADVLDITCDCPGGGPQPDPHTTIDPTRVIFGAPDVPAVPAGFFGPGSDPFEGTVALHAGPTDTLVQRMSEADCPATLGACEPIAIEIVALDLVSVGPMTVTFGMGNDCQGATDPDACVAQWCDDHPGQCEDWDLEIGLSGGAGSGLGSLLPTKTHANGGLYDARLPVLPSLTFTRGADTLFLDYGDEGLDPIEINFFDVPWVVNLGPHLVGYVDAPSDGNFVPGVDEVDAGDPDSQVVVYQFGHSKGGGVDHTVRIPTEFCDLPGNPADDPCAPFQQRDCVGSPADLCLVHTVQIMPDGPEPIECACYDAELFPCGPIHYDPAAGTVSCPGACYPPEIPPCQIWVDDGSGLPPVATGKVSAPINQFPGGALLFCDCEPPCEDDSDCPDKCEVCDEPSGVCVPAFPGCCESDADCTGKCDICALTSNTCVKGIPDCCTGDTQCGKCERCDLSDNTCFIPAGSTCCETDDDCTGKCDICDTFTNECVKGIPGCCTSNAQCPGKCDVCNVITNTCQKLHPTDCCDSDDQCIPLFGAKCGRCDPATNTCFKATDCCSSDAQCPPDEKCFDSYCDLATNTCQMSQVFPGCCTSNEECPDKCDVCNLVTNTCEKLHPTDCCDSDDQCAPLFGAKCGRCAPATNMCFKAPDCCDSDAQCPPDPKCFDSYCDTATNTCRMSGKFPGCCTSNAQCPGKCDICNVITNTCYKLPPEDCCDSDAQCTLFATKCRPGLCNFATNMCFTGPKTPPDCCEDDSQCTDFATKCRPGFCDFVTNTCVLGPKTPPDCCESDAQCTGKCEICDPVINRCVIDDASCTGACCDKSQPGGACTSYVPESECPVGPQVQWYKDQLCIEDPGGTIDCLEHTGACCLKDRPTGLCLSWYPESLCPVGPQVQWYKDEVCEDDGGTVVCLEHTGACCDKSQPGGVCVSGVHESDCLPPPVTFFTEKSGFEAFMLQNGKMLKGVETFEESNVPPGRIMCIRDPLQGNVPNVDASGYGFPEGLAEKNLIIQTNITPGPNPPAPNPWGAPCAIFVFGQGYADSNSIKVGEYALYDFAASLDLIFTDPNPTGVGFELSRPPPPSPNDGWHISVYNKSDELYGKFQVPPGPVEPGKVFFGVWRDRTIGRINIYDKAGLAFDAVDNIQMWVGEESQFQWYKEQDCIEDDPINGIDCLEHTGACCDGATGVCVNGILPDDCTCEQCEWFKDTPCSAIVCDQHTGACCDHNTGICVDGVLPHDCFGPQLEWFKDLLCDDIVCCPVANPPNEPNVRDVGFGTANRYIGFSIKPTPIPIPQYIRITMVDLDPPHDVCNGQQKWVGQPFAVCEASGDVVPGPTTCPNGPLTWVAPLQNEQPANPIDWSVWDEVWVYDEQIVPNSVYHVQAIDGTCDKAIEDNFSVPLVYRTSRYGDIVRTFDLDTCITKPKGYTDCWTAPQGFVDFDDITAVVDKFTNLPGAPKKVRADLMPCLPDFKIDFSDIPAVVDGFLGLPYPCPPAAKCP